MPSKDPIQRFEDILENIGFIAEFTRGMDLKAFLEDLKTRNATERCMERISEAARKLGNVAEDLCPDVPWPDLRALGNFLRHEYDRVDAARVWVMIEVDPGAAQSRRPTCSRRVTACGRVRRHRAGTAPYRPRPALQPYIEKNRHLEMDRRRFLGNTLLALPAARAAHARSLRLEEVTISGLERAYREGSFTARAAVEWYLERIESLDKRGPRVNAVIEINPDALRIAEALDRERLSGHVRGPLHGVPFLMKDNIDTADRMSTTCGSLALVNRATVRDAFIVHALRASGAVLLGKTNLSEWAGFRSTSSISGWSGRGGLTHNPYALDRNASGSSSGSAAAVSSNFSALGVGTESDGSVTAPASVNGIVGIKPTVGLLSRSGIIPISHSQDTAGPMARTVRDAAILLSAMTGKAGVDYTKYLDERGLKGMRLGVERNYFGSDVATNRLFGNCLAEMKRHGAELVDPANLPSHGEYDEDELEVFLYEFKAGLNAYLARRPGAGVRSLADVIAFNEQRSSEEMPYFRQDLLERAQAKGSLTGKAYLDARARCVKLSRAEGIDAVIHKYKLDAIVAPTAGPAPRNTAIPGTEEWPVCTKPAAVAGYPHITVPAGLVNGLPVGISFFGPAWSEPVMLKLAYALEQATRARQQPAFARSAIV